MTDDRCRKVEDHLDELALGVLGGRDRAELLAHLEHCSICSRRVQEASEIGDALLELVPGTEPPIGFENRVLGRQAAVTGSVAEPVDLNARRRNRRSVPWKALTLAAACSAAFFVGGVELRGVDRSPAPSATATSSVMLTAAPLRAGGRTIGSVYLDTGSHPWIYVGLQGVDVHTTSVNCVLTYSDGHVEDLGANPVAAGTAGWGARIPGNASDVTGARIIAHGVTVATAAL